MKTSAFLFLLPSPTNPIPATRPPLRASEPDPWPTLPASARMLAASATGRASVRMLAASATGEPAESLHRVCDSRSRGRWHSTIAAGLMLLLAAMVLLTAPTAAGADEALDGYNLAVGLYKQNRWTLAAEKFQDYLRRHPRHDKVPFARLYLGLSLVNLEKYADAREVLRGYVKDYPNSANLPDALYRVGECSYLLDDLKAAETELQAFLTKSPDNPLGEWAWPYLGDTQLRLDKPTAAVASFRRSLERFPQGQMAEDSKFGLAKAYQAVKQHDEAIALYRELAADRTGSRAPQAQLNLGTLHFDRENYADAAAAFLRVEQQFPESRLLPSARLNAGYSYYQLGDYRSAVVLFDKAAGDESQAGAARFWKGVCLKALEQYAEAAEVLQAAFEADSNGPMAERTLFQWADCQLRNKQYDEAHRRFLELVRRWPDGDLADDSLHYAAEAALSAGRLDEAAALLQRFGREYPGSGLRMHHELLQGRLRNARGGEENLKRALAHFQKVLAETNVPRTESLARMYLAQTWHKLGDSAQAVEAVGPLVERIKDDETAEFADALVLHGLCLLEQKDYAAAGASLSRYLELQPQGAQADQALAARALAEAKQGNAAQAKFDLETLAGTFPESPLLGRTMHELAETAYAARKWDAAQALFSELAALGTESPYHAKGLSGLAWSRYQQQDYDEAAQSFARLIRQHPDDVLASEAAYMQGKALEAAGRTEQAAEAYGQAFRTLGPKLSGQGQRDDEGLARHVYLSGRQAARMLKALDKTDEADAAYDALQKQFRRDKDRDKLLEEWALLNYEAERFERSDEIFKRLIAETPASSRAESARLSLAESDLIAGRLEQAEQAFRGLEARPQAPADVQQAALYHLIGLAAERADWRELLKAADRLNRRFPDGNFRRHALFYTGEAHLHLGELEQARDVFLQLKADEPDAEQTAASRSDWSPRIWVLLAEAQFRLKQYEEVEAAVNELRSRDPDSRYLYQADEVLGRSYKNQAKFDQARTAFRRAIDDPHGRRTETAAKSQLMVAETYLLQRDYKRALEEYLKVHILYKFPEWQSLAVYQAARCHESLDEWQSAVKTYEMLLKEFPKSEKAAEAQQRLTAARKRAGG